MWRYILHRLGQGVLVLFALYTLVFWLSEAMPGEPFSATEKNISPEVRENMKKAFGLDKEPWQRYFIYPWTVVTQHLTGLIIRQRAKSLMENVRLFLVRSPLGQSTGRLRAACHEKRSFIFRRLRNCRDSSLQI